MKGKNKVLLVLMAAFILVLSACTPSPGTTPDVSSSAGESETPSASENLFPGRVSDLNGRVITINLNGALDEFSRAGIARLARDKEIEEMYNVKIEYLIQQNETGGNFDIVNSVFAGEPLVDIWVQNGFTELVPHYRQGAIMPLDDLQVFDWDEYSDILKIAKFGGQHYLINHKINSTGGGRNAIWATYVTLYNQKLLNDYGITDDLMELQRTGQWTWDKFAEIAARFNQNAPGDIRALFEWNNVYDMILGSHRADWVTLNTEGGFSFGAGTQEAQNALSMYRDLTSQGVITIEDDHLIALGWDGFNKGKAAFLMAPMYGMRWIITAQGTTDVKENWGMLTIPQLEPGVENLQAITYNELAGYSIPTGVTNPNEVATILNEWILVEMDPEEEREAFIETYVLENLNVLNGDKILETANLLYDICEVEADVVLNSAFTMHTEPGIGAWTVGTQDSWYTHAREIARGNVAMGTTITSLTPFYNNILAEFTRQD